MTYQRTKGGLVSISNDLTCTRLSYNHHLLDIPESGDEGADQSVSCFENGGANCVDLAGEPLPAARRNTERTVAPSISESESYKESISTSESRCSLRRESYESGEGSGILRSSSRSSLSRSSTWQDLNQWGEEEGYSTSDSLEIEESRDLNASTSTIDATLSRIEMEILELKGEIDQITLEIENKKNEKTPSRPFFSASIFNLSYDLPFAEEDAESICLYLVTLSEDELNQFFRLKGSEPLNFEIIVESKGQPPKNETYCFEFDFMKGKATYVNIKTRIAHVVYEESAAERIFGTCFLLLSIMQLDESGEELKAQFKECLSRFVKGGGVETESIRGFFLYERIYTHINGIDTYGIDFLEKQKEFLLESSELVAQEELRDYRKLQALYRELLDDASLFDKMNKLFKDPRPAKLHIDLYKQFMDHYEHFKKCLPMLKEMRRRAIRKLKRIESRKEELATTQRNMVIRHVTQTTKKGTTAVELVNCTSFIRPSHYESFPLHYWNYIDVFYDHVGVSLESHGHYYMKLIGALTKMKYMVNSVKSTIDTEYSIALKEVHKRTLSDQLRKLQELQH